MLDTKRLEELKEYIDSHLNVVLFDVCESISVEKNYEQLPNIELEDFVKNNRKPRFNEVLFKFIDKKGVSDSDIYKRACMDRRHFSKIRSNPDYRIGKSTAIALALSLQLNKKETDTLLSAAGFSLSDSGYI
ncbi:hypothetical protein [Tepidibacillus marianensis]|uniref:hypothetical protein n=1 Tax=Tepidibacillus marianensis TaxID=3131995 RepID=UPI0030D5CC50